MEEDYTLIQQYLNGDDNSLKVLIDKHTSSIYNFTFRFVGPLYAQDIVQEVFIKAWENLKSFNSDKSQFKTWLFVITRNTITDYLRKKKSISFSSLDDEDFKEEEIEDESILQDEIFEKLEDKKMLLKILDELPPNYKLVLTLYYQEDMTFKEIGEVLGKPMNTVKSYHHRALVLLKKKLE
ncbi:MAG: sigma-70 family RNA polymerase sigma factor [Candidatus Paceibacterota bacterium]|jgi:RNA polymerase sigma-70 factor (ECF subfamily)